MNARVSLSPIRSAPRRLSEIRSGCALPLLDPAGARVILGAPAGAVPAAPIVPACNALFGPRGAVLGGNEGPLFVTDTGHHRLMIWRRRPESDNEPADLVIGQPDFRSEGPNGHGRAGPATFKVPTGVAFECGVLAVADAWNHRVLIWRQVPDRCNQPADVVIGQSNYTSTLANRGSDSPRADTLNWCYGVALHGKRLYIADTGNRRVLIWNEIPARNGAPADMVIGQPDFSTRDDISTVEPAVGMRWPHGICIAGERLLVADAGTSRVQAWTGVPDKNGAPCDFVFGQADFRASDHNAGEYEPTSASLNMPYGVCAGAGQVIVADTANSRLLGFDPGSLAMGQAANRLAGQRNFSAKGDNRWQPPARDSLCWPYGVSASGHAVVIADSGNNRVLIWEAA